MTPLIGASFGLSKFQLGLLAAVNLLVFAVASLVVGTDRGPHRTAQGHLRAASWCGRSRPSARRCRCRSRCCCSSARWSASGRARTAPAPTRCCAPTPPPEKRGRALGIYNVGMALGGTSGLVLGAMLAPHIGWRGVFWIAGAPSMLLALASAFVAAPDRLPRPHALPARAYLLAPTYIMALAGGILATFGASALIFWSRWLVIEERHFAVVVGSVFMALVGPRCRRRAASIAGGYAGRRAHASARVAAMRWRSGCRCCSPSRSARRALLVTWKPLFMVLTTLTVFLLSVYNGPSAAIVDELGPPQFAATLQAVFMFGIHVLGNAPAASVVGCARGPFQRLDRAAGGDRRLRPVGRAVRDRRAPAAPGGRAVTDARSSTTTASRRPTTTSATAATTG